MSFSRSLSRFWSSRHIRVWLEVTWRSNGRDEVPVTYSMPCAAWVVKPSFLPYSPHIPVVTFLPLYHLFLFMLIKKVGNRGKISLARCIVRAHQPSLVSTFCCVDWLIFYLQHHSPVWNIYYCRWIIVVRVLFLFLSLLHEHIFTIRLNVHHHHTTNVRRGCIYYIYN